MDAHSLYEKKTGACSPVSSVLYTAVSFDRLCFMSLNDVHKGSNMRANDLLEKISGGPKILRQLALRYLIQHTYVTVRRLC